MHRFTATMADIINNNKQRKRETDQKEKEREGESELRQNLKTYISPFTIDFN